MPNYRQKNRNRNKNKNRNKQQQQQQQQTEEHSKKTERSVQSPTTESQTTTADENVTTAVGPRVDKISTERVPSLDGCTVSHESVTARTENVNTATECGITSDQNMGNVKSKIEEDEHRDEVIESPVMEREVLSTPRQQAKVIVHRVVCEDISELTRHPATNVKEDIDNATELQQIISSSEESVSAKECETDVKDSINNNKDSSDIIAKSSRDESPSSENEQCKSETKSEECLHEPLQEQVKVIVHQIHVENENDRETAILSPVHIEEVVDESLTDLDELRSPIVSEVESSAEYEDVDTESDGMAEQSSSAVSQREKRKQKRLALENHFLPQMLNPRFLDSISEENSDPSECGDNPLSRSESTENAANPTELKAQKLNAKFPKSSLDFSKTHKHTLTLNTQGGRCAIREEPLALAVEARLQEAPDADESCTTLKSFLSPESELAEMVFINSASSSMSDLNEMDAIDRVSLHSAASLAFDLDTDAKDLINKPGAEQQLTSSSSAGNMSISTAVKSSQNNGKENDSNNVNNSQIPSSVSSPAIDQLVFLNANEEQNPQSSSTLFSYGSGQQRSANDDALSLLSDTQARLLETSCDSINTKSISSLRADRNAKPPPQGLTENVQNMNTVRDILNTDNTQTANTNGNKNAINGDFVIKQFSQTLRGSPPPPPIPPPPTTLDTASPPLPLLVQNVEQHNGQHTENKRSQQSASAQSPNTTAHKSLASTLSSLTRQESQDSHCSDSTTFSQCTAINVGSNHNKASDHTSSISDLKLYETSKAPQQQKQHQPLHKLEEPSSPIDPKKLRLLCAETLAALPFGDDVLEELATLAQNIGEVRAINVLNSGHTTDTTAITTQDTTKMPYPLPELPHIDDLQLCLNKANAEAPRRPPSPNRPDSWLGVPTTSDPKLLVCLSPSQRSYIQQQQQQNVITSATTKETGKPDDLLDAHQRFVERRGYHEYSKEQLANLEREKLAEQQLLQTAALMKKLRKSLTPPPPQIPPPPVPAKSSETAAIAQNLSKRSMASTSSTTTTSTIKTNNDVTISNVSDRTALNDGEENKHRLLSIIHDTSGSLNDHQQQEKKAASTATSSVENNSRQTSTSIRQHPATPQQSPSTFIVPIALTNGSSTKPYSFPATSGNMQSVESTLGEMFPTLGSSDIFDSQHKRFSNIESSTSQPLLDSKPKRFSCIESHSYESKKRVENGQVVQDYSNSKHEKQKYGDAPETETATYNKFPAKTPLSSDAQLFSSAPTPHESTQSILMAEKAKPDDHEIMSALNLNKHSSETMNNSRQTTTHTMSSNITKTEKSESNHRDEVDFVKRNEFEEQQTQNASERMTALKRGIEDTYEEFRQRAKEAAAVTATAAPVANMLPTAQVTSNGESTANGSRVISSSSTATTTNKTVFQHDHEKLFKEFDDLSKQLNRELEMGKTQRDQKEKSTSLYDLNRIQLRQKEQIEEFNKQRHGHMKELEREIERSMKSRQLRMGSMERSCSVDLSNGRTHEIPIHLENGHTTYTNGNGTPSVPELPRTYQIPIQIENGSSVDDSRSRRAESMFDLSTEESTRRRTYSNQQRVEDDWSKYASDLGSSENIARPFAKEVEICYQRRPGGIRAPRMTASTNDLTYNTQSFDQHNAYNVRRSHAPMLNRAPQQNRPHYGSCYSMIERDPNPKYISTTSRRGVSPAPQPSGFHPMEVSVSENDMRQRRASLPRELHEQQLKYITSKEEELRTEFDRLQNERRRLMEEMSQASTMPLPQPSPRPMRDPYRSVPKLPTLTEDEVFRQQMAEEWLNKVAEREKRRLQNIIKISKLQEDEVAGAQHTMQANLGDEFLNRVKERRTKLAMPADSDWESGAESQPVNQAQFSETEEMPPVKILEGESEANLRSLPRHLREFAKFSNHQRDEIEGGHREQHQEEERSQEATDNSFSKAFKKSTVVKTVKTLRAPMLPENGGQGESINANQKKNVLNASANSCNTNANINNSSNNIDDTDTQINSLLSFGVGSVLGTAVVIGLSAWTAWRRFT